MPLRRPHRSTGRPRGRPPETGSPSAAQIALQHPHDPFPYERSITPAQEDEAAKLIGSRDARLMALAHMALGHRVQNPSSSRSMVIMRQALHDLMVALGDITEQGLRVNLQQNAEGSGVTFVVMTNGRGPQEPQAIEAEGEVVEQLPADAIQNPPPESGNQGE